MKLLILSTFSVLGATIGNAQAADVPFTLAVVPSRSSGEAMSIQIGGADALPFYAVLTNRSKKGEEVFETWNSWGYYNVEFEATMPDGKKLQIKRGPNVWPTNNPTRFLIPPGERQVMVFPSAWPLNVWSITPASPGNGEYEVRLKAIYEVVEDEENKNISGVWLGRVESPEYKMKVTFTSPTEMQPMPKDRRKAEQAVGKSEPEQEHTKPKPKASE